jgi:hypothetical protein
MHLPYMTTRFGIGGKFADETIVELKTSHVNQ